MPGGMMGTLKTQLAETRPMHLLPKVLEEAEWVRADLGYPNMVTPFSQVVATQVVFNIVDGEQLNTIPDEMVRYILGHFGAPTVPLDANLEDRVKSSLRGKELRDEPVMASLDDLRAKFGKNYCDEEFLLRAVMPADQVDAMVATAPAPRTYNPNASVLKDLIRALTTKIDLNLVRITKPGFRLELSGGS